MVKGLERHLAPLLALRDEGVVPGRRESVWYPQEVLELIGYSQPGDSAWEPGGKGFRGHWMRAFACAALLRIFGAENEGSFLRGGLVIQLMDSLHALDVGLERETASLLAWIIAGLAEQGDDKLPFLGVALLWAALQPAVATSDDVIAGLCEWTSAVEDHFVDKRWVRSYGDAGWLLSGVSRSMYANAWREFGDRLRGLDLSARGPEVQNWVRLIGTVLAGD